MNQLFAKAMQQRQQKPQDSTVIDFNTMLKTERARAQQTLSLKLTTALNVFNLLQDMRHLIILDFREEAAFNTNHIRKSINVTVENYSDQVVTAMLSSQDERFRSHYAGDDLKRVLYILPEGDEGTQMAQTLSGQLAAVNTRVQESSGKDLAIHKAFYVKDFESAFLVKYPLLCLPSGQVSTLQEVRALSRFPSEIKKDSLYLGNMTNILNRDYFQLRMLNIKTIFYLTQGPFTEIDEHFNCVHIQMNELEKPEIDFDALSQQVQELMGNPDTGPVLLLCVSGQLSGALAIKVSMDTNRTFAANPQIASTYVMQRRHELKDIEPWLFSQVQPFVPGAAKPKPPQAASTELTQQAASQAQQNSAVEEMKEEEKAELVARIQEWKQANQDLQTEDQEGSEAPAAALINTAEPVAQNPSESESNEPPTTQD